AARAISVLLASEPRLTRTTLGPSAVDVRLPIVELSVAAFRGLTPRVEAKRALAVGVFSAPLQVGAFRGTVASAVHVRFVAVRDLVVASRAVAGAVFAAETTHAVAAHVALLVQLTGRADATATVLVRFAAILPFVLAARGDTQVVDAGLGSTVRVFATRLVRTTRLARAAAVDPRLVLVREIVDAVTRLTTSPVAGAVDTSVVVVAALAEPAFLRARAAAILIGLVPIQLPIRAARRLFESELGGRARKREADGDDPEQRGVRHRLDEATEHPAILPEIPPAERCARTPSATMRAAVRAGSARALFRISERRRAAAARGAAPRAAHTAREGPFRGDVGAGPSHGCTSGRLY